MELILDIKNGKSETIKIDDDVYMMLIEYSKQKKIPVEKAIEIICLEYAKQFEKEDF